LTYPVAQVSAQRRREDIAGKTQLGKSCQGRSHFDDLREWVFGVGGLPARYLSAVLSVIYGNELPKDAIRCAEAGRCNGGEAEGNERGADA
jgi:hypothetical protein